MGLAQVIERPRNWVCQTGVGQDSVSATEDGEYLPMIGFATNLNSNDVLRLLRLPYNIVIERFGIVLSSNTLDALSTNTITMEVNEIDTTNILTLTDSSGVAALLQVTAMGQAVTADTPVSFRWNSDSVGAAGFRNMMLCYRIVNPRA